MELKDVLKLKFAF